MINGDFSESWLQRARTEGMLDVSLGLESSAATQAFTVMSRDGWDPWEVWLRYIDQPRRHRTGRPQRLPV